ncbi:MAG: type II toxin-antitoxin system RelE/ParE family toxin [Bacteroidales bacterium]|jgi:phage-related protein|nr:type II toxin-antitoxin system RelE/ParE family toxin [Bacteroidales bacterium]MBQ2148699.1 type II toxin-antitoxin system RelE/ParE family toxin [Bacteroidales bacterium]MBQ5481319.1 type II toxin-antitoxin system RelE/ParE family toxin [Clostridia bacterium]
MKKEFVRQVVVFENHFKEFRKTLNRETLKKLYQVLTLIMMVEEVPAQFLRAIVGRKGLFEIRVEHGNNIYRVFCCFDEDKLVILFNGFQKKTQKTPAEQLDKAEALMKKYYDQKSNRTNG